MLKSGGRLATYGVVLNSAEPRYPVPWARSPATSFLLTATVMREAIEPAGSCALAWQDDSEAAKIWIAQLCASGPPSPNLGVVMGAGLRAAFRQPGTKSHGRPDWHPGRGVRGRVNEPAIGTHMSPEILLQTHLVLGYVAWLLCFGVYIWPRLKAMDHTCRTPGEYAAWLEALPDNQRQSVTADALPVTCDLDPGELLAIERRGASAVTKQRDSPHGMSR